MEETPEPEEIKDDAEAGLEEDDGAVDPSSQVLKYGELRYRFRVRCHQCGNGHMDKLGSSGPFPNGYRYGLPHPCTVQDVDKEDQWEKLQGEERFLRMTSPGFGGLLTDESQFIRLHLTEESPRRVAVVLGKTWGSQWYRCKLNRCLKKIESGLLSLLRNERDVDAENASAHGILDELPAIFASSLLDREKLSQALSDTT